MVVACVLPHAGAAVDGAQVSAFLRERPASYKVPRHVPLFAEEDVALTGSAEIKTSDLRLLAAQRLADD
ncbi:hypothetical protein ACRS6B_14640 [Nocardia asteroides]